MRNIAPFLLAAAIAGCSGANQKDAGNDALATVAVKAKLAGVDVDSTTAVNVNVRNGVVTLTGQARNIGERDDYVAAARSADGVTSVVDRLAVNANVRGLREQSADAALAAKVAAAIAGQAGVNVFHVKTSARDGVVTLEGAVPSAAIEQTVIATARSVSGVKRVDARLTIQR